MKIGTSTSFFETLFVPLVKTTLGLLARKSATLGFYNR